MNLHVTADKYLIPKLSANASKRFCFVARARKSTDDIFDIMEAIRTELRKKHLSNLLRNDRFRAQLDSGGKVAMWKQLDELNSKDLVTDKEEKSYSLCSQYEREVFKEAAKDEGKAHCPLCLKLWNSGIVALHTGQHTIHKAWIKK